MAAFFGNLRLTRYEMRPDNSRVDNQTGKPRYYRHPVEDTYRVDIEVDTEKLLKKLGDKALANRPKLGKLATRTRWHTSALSGLIKAEVRKL